MNTLTRRLAISGARFSERIQSFAGASIVSFPFEHQQHQQHPQQKHQFGSFPSGHDCSLSDLNLKNKLSELSLLPSSSTRRGFSSNATISATSNNNEQKKRILSPTNPTMFTDSESGKQFGVIIDTRNLPKLKPGIVKRRLDKCRTYIGRERSIRQSPWKLNRICQLAAGLTLEEALTQLKFCELKNADLVAKVLKRTSNLADIRDCLQISQLEVKECFATKSLMLKRIKMMGRGRHGVMHHKHSHISLVLREIDFPLRIYQQKSLNQKKKWMFHQQRAKKDAEAAKAKREEVDRLTKQQEAQLEERKAAARK